LNIQKLHIFQLSLNSLIIMLNEWCRGNMVIILFH